jgi:hypothetical protein
MKKLLVLALVATFGLLVTTCQKADRQQQGPEGVWKIDEIKTVDANGQTTDMNVQRSLVIFRDGHYSFVFTFGDGLRKLAAEHWYPTDAEKIDAFNTLVVNTGTYELTESRLVFRPLAAKAEEFAGGHYGCDYRIDGDTLYLIETESVSVGGVQWDYDSSGKWHYKLSRVQDAIRLTNK